jgi:hypothetical protein
MWSIRIIKLTFIVLFIAIGSSSAQIPRKGKKLLGKWQHTQDKGFEVWQESSTNTLYGEAFRVTEKGDTLKIEEMRLVFHSKKKIQFFARVFNQNEGREIVFTSKGSKFFFENPTHDFPRAIQYKFNCFSRKKLTVSLYHPHMNKLPHVIPMVKKQLFNPQ